MKNNKYDFLEESLGNINSENTVSIDKKSNELSENIQKNITKLDKAKEKPAPSEKEKEKEKVYDNISPALKKILKRIDSETFGPLESSMRFEKEAIHNLKSICVELNIPAYKLVTILIRDFIEKYKE